MHNRSKMSKGKSRRSFKKSTGVHRVNRKPPATRTGTRL